MLGRDKKERKNGMKAKPFPLKENSPTYSSTKWESFNLQYYYIYNNMSPTPCHLYGHTHILTNLLIKINDDFKK